MYYRFCLSILLLTSGYTAIAEAADVACVVYPAYPYSGSNWLHYCIRRSSPGCVYIEPMGRVMPYTPAAQQCEFNQCVTLRENDESVKEDQIAVVASDLYYSGDNPVSYDRLNTADYVKEFIKARCNQAQHSRVDSMHFSTPNVAGEELRPSIAKTNRLSDGRTVYFVLWKMGRFGALTGIQIEDYPGNHSGVGLFVADEVRRARTKIGHEFSEIPGMLELSMRGKTYLVRLHDTAENRRQNAYLPIRDTN